jgi:hypothetical protein
MADIRTFGAAVPEPRSREDFQALLIRLCAPFADPGDFGHRLEAVSHPSAVYAPRVARLELVSRLLWGLAPLAAGGGKHPGWQQIRAEIVRGTDPSSAGFWALATTRDQRIVESAALGFALALAPDELWRPLTGPQRASFAHWLRTAASAEAVDNNWRLFATLVNLGLSSVGESYDRDVTASSFRRIDAFYQGDGWYSDGVTGNPFDYYGPWAIHFYSLINAAHGGIDADTASRVRERARLHAGEFVHWFAADGAALPFGRSLTYRFAQCSFFGALAYAAEGEGGDPAEALTWGQVRGLWARNLRWWSQQPILHGDGTLSIGYAYPQPQMSEAYNAPGSPYWAFKAFLPLALPADHPFWVAEEEPLPRLEPVHAQPTAAFLLQRTAQGQVTALSAAPGGRWARHGEAKYGKFAYSTAFGFSVPSQAVGLAGAGGDSMLLLSDDGVHWRAREEPDELWPMQDGGGDVMATWSPWPDVNVETLMVPVGEDGRWHARVHCITTARPLWTAEGGFCVPLGAAEPGDGEQRSAPDQQAEPRDSDHPVYAADDESAFAAAGNLCSGVRDLTENRHGEIVRPDPNTHLLWPRTLLPTLRGELAPGSRHLVTLVYTDTGGDAAGFANPPTCADLQALGIPDDVFHDPE